MRSALTTRRAARAARAESTRWHLERISGPVVAGMCDADLGFAGWAVVAMVAAFMGLTIAIVVSI